MIKKIIFVLLYWASVIGLIFVLAVTVGLAVDEAAFIAAFFFVLFVLIVVIKIYLARKRKKLKKKFSEAAELMNEGHVKDFDAVIRQQILMKKRKKSTSGKKRRLKMHKGIIIGAAFIGLSMAIAGGYQRQKAAELFSGVIADSQSNYVENVPDISENKESYEEKVSNISEETDIPEVLLEFAEKYPEASDFVAEYPQKKDLHPEIDLEQEVEKGTIPLFIQWDERWGYERYGSNFHGVAACGPTCLSMVVCGLTGETKWNPYEVAQFSEQKGYYISGVGTSWELMTNGAQELGLTAAREDIGEKIIREKLSEDTPMICSVGPGDFTDSGHFIVLRSIDEDGKIILNDSNSRINSEKHWDLKVLLPQIKAIWRFQVQ